MSIDFLLYSTFVDNTVPKLNMCMSNWVHIMKKNHWLQDFASKRLED